VTNNVVRSAYCNNPPGGHNLCAKKITDASEAIATELRALQIPAVADAVDTAFNAAFGKTPTEAIGDATKKTASRLYEAGAQVADLAKILPRRPLR
jgi:hypothetical protein